MLVIRASCHIVDVGMELHTVYVGEVPREDPQWYVLLCVPEFCGPIVGARNEVLAKRREFDLPDWEAMAIEHVHEAPILQRPKTN